MVDEFTKELTMTQVILDAPLVERLHNLRQPLELCDESGRVLARVTPVYDPAEYVGLEPQISDDELRRRERSDKWYTTQEVLARLKSLENQ